MTLDDAIKHCEEKAEELEKRLKPYQCESINKKLYEVNKKEWDSCLECAKEHRQLAEWLRELKAYRYKYADISRVASDDESCDEIWERAYAERDGKK
jgi:protein subunit release factor A